MTKQLIATVLIGFGGLAACESAVDENVGQEEPPATASTAASATTAAPTCDTAEPSARQSTPTPTPTPTPEPTPEPSPTLQVYDEPTVEDIDLEIVVLEKSCSGDECQIGFHTRAAWGPGIHYDPALQYTLTYRVDGELTGEYMNSLAILGDDFISDEIEFVDVPASDPEIRAVPVEVFLSGYAY